MSQAEKYSWVSLFSTGLIFWFFQMRMLDGVQILEQSAGALFDLYITIVIVFIIAEVTIAGVIAVRRGKHDIEKDERDLLIETKSEQYASWFTVTAINILIIHLLADATFPDHAFPRIDMSDPATLFFVMFSVLFGATIVQRVSTLAMYRWQNVRG